MRRTRKFLAGQRCLFQNDLPFRASTNDGLYGYLDSEGYTWDQGLGEWREKREDEYPENAPDGIPGAVRIRINANMSEIAGVYQVVADAIEQAGGRVVDVSRYYPNTRKGTGVRQYLQVYLPERATP